MAEAKDILKALAGQQNFQRGVEQHVPISALDGLIEGLDQVEAQKLLFTTMRDVQPVGDGPERRIVIPAKYFEGL